MASETTTGVVWASRIEVAMASFMASNHAGSSVSLDFFVIHSSENEVK
jgi:hypothetical protein